MSDLTIMTNELFEEIKRQAQDVHQPLCENNWDYASALFNTGTIIASLGFFHTGNFIFWRKYFIKCVFQRLKRSKENSSFPFSFSSERHSIFFLSGWLETRLQSLSSRESLIRELLWKLADLLLEFLSFSLLSLVFLLRLFRLASQIFQIKMILQGLANIFFNFFLGFRRKDRVLWCVVFLRDYNHDRRLRRYPFEVVKYLILIFMNGS